MEEKINYAVELLEKISRLSEIVLVNDDGGLIDYRGNISEWFSSIVSSRQLLDKMTFVVITKYKVNFESVRRTPSIFSQNVPELNRTERIGLLRRLATANKLELSRRDMDEIGQHLTGYPAQVYYAVGRIQNEKAQSMYGRCKALYQAYVEHNYDAALHQIDTVAAEFPRDKKYALVVKFDIAQFFEKIETMQDTIKELEAERTNNNTVVICKSKLLAAQNKVDEAVQYFTTNISFFTDESKKNFCERLKAHYA